MDRKIGKCQLDDFWSKVVSGCMESSILKAANIGFHRGSGRWIAKSEEAYMRYFEIVIEVAEGLSKIGQCIADLHLKATTRFAFVEHGLE